MQNNPISLLLHYGSTFILQLQFKIKKNLNQLVEICRVLLSVGQDGSPGGGGQGVCS